MVPKRRKKDAFYLTFCGAAKAHQKKKFASIYGRFEPFCALFDMFFQLAKCDVKCILFSRFCRHFGEEKGPTLTCEDLCADEHLGMARFVKEDRVKEI